MFQFNHEYFVVNNDLTAFMDKKKSMSFLCRELLECVFFLFW